MQTENNIFQPQEPTCFTTEQAKQLVDSIAISADTDAMCELCVLLRGIASDETRASFVARHALKQAFTYHPDFEAILNQFTEGESNEQTIN